MIPKAYRDDMSRNPDLSSLGDPSSVALSIHASSLSYESYSMSYLHPPSKVLIDQRYLKGSISSILSSPIRIWAPGCTSPPTYNFHFKESFILVSKKSSNMGPVDDIGPGSRSP